VSAKLKDAANLALGVLGLFGTLFGVWAYYDTKAISQLHYTTTSKTVFSPPEHFRILPVVDGTAPFQDEAVLNQTLVTVWNSGNVSIHGADARLPFAITGNDSTQILAARIVQTRTPIVNNFTLKHIDAARLELHWKLIDPDMAVKIAILHTGPSGGLLISGNFGPGTKITALNMSNFLGIINMMTIFLVPTVIFFA
jgi:hypothetical protein